MEEVKININDAKKAIYFIANLTQMQGDKPMQGALSSKADYMGGIMDRWINIIPESVLFNKIILPRVFNGENIEVINDYYDYNPKIAGIAPDVIGIKYKKDIIPFVKYNNTWIALENRPQIEVKTFKKNQYMVSLRNQNYDNKYLVVAEANFRIDYLIPLLNKSLFSKHVFLDLHMNDKIFIISNEGGKIAQPHKVELSDKTLGSVKLLKVTTALEFMKKAVKCESRVSVIYIKTCEEYTSSRLINFKSEKLSDYCKLDKNGLYYFIPSWYEKIYKDGVKAKSTGFYASSIKDIELLKKNKSSFYIKAKKDCMWQSFELKKDHIYIIKTGILDRSSNDSEEYFMSKYDINMLSDSMENLSNDLKQVVFDYKNDK